MTSSLEYHDERIIIRSLEILKNLLTHFYFEIIQLKFFVFCKMKFLIFVSKKSLVNLF